MKIIILSILLLASTFSMVHAETNDGIPISETIRGSAQTVDGDGLIIKGQKIRLQGIDAAEWDQSCELDNGKDFYPGREAEAWLKSLIANQVVCCDVETTDRYNRKIAICYLQGTNINKTLVQEAKTCDVQDININKALVQEGHAFTNSFYTERYVEYEKEAESDEKGVWRGCDEKPWEWRKKNPR